MEALDRLLTLVQRELGADDVRVLDAGETAPAAANVVHATMPDGRVVVVTYANMPSDGDARQRRLEMLVRTFAQSLAEDAEPGSRRPSSIPTSLGEELKALATRAQALDALVVDADSPVVWGAANTADRYTAAAGASAKEALGLLDQSRRQLIDDVRDEIEAEGGDHDANDPIASPEPPPAAPSEIAITETVDPEALSRDAVRSLRALPAIANLHKGRHLHHAAQGEPWYVAQSFAGIYVLVLVFRAAYDELRAERAILEALPRIERMVLAMPPLDPEPEPTADVIHLRRRR